MFGFGGEDPVPCSERARKLAEAVCNVMKAKQDLDEAEDIVPSYTGQWSRFDYTAEAQEAFYRAAEELEKVVFG